MPDDTDPPEYAAIEHIPNESTDPTPLEVKEDPTVPVYGPTWEQLRDSNAVAHKRGEDAMLRKCVTVLTALLQEAGTTKQQIAHLVLRVKNDVAKL